MRIALVGLRLTVGPRLITDTLGAALEALGHEVIFVGTSEHHFTTPLRSFPVSDGTTYGAMLREAADRAVYRSALQALGPFEPEVCYFVSVHPANASLARAIRRRVRTPRGDFPRVAVHIHDPLPHPGLAWPLIMWAQQQSVRAADRVVVYGEVLAGQMARYYGIPRDRVVVVPHGASRAPASEAPPETECRWFSFLGRIARYKGLGLFLEAARRLQRDCPGAGFYVGGSGNLRPHARALARLAGAVTVDNRELTNDETDEVMRRSWAVVLPYRSGTQSGVIPVAYWNGCPVITTRVGALSEVVRDGETGFIVERDDTDGLVERMRGLYGNRGRRRAMGASGFAFYRRALRWETIAGGLLHGITG